MDIPTDWVTLLETEHIVNYIHELNLLNNPWFIAGALIFVVGSLMLKWHLLLTCTLSLAGMLALTSLVHQQGTDLSQSSDSLFMFIGGGAIIVFFLIYMVFMRGD